MTITLDAYPKVRFSGKVSRIAPAARLQDQVKVFDVEVALDSQGKELLTGMTANVLIKGDRAAHVVAAPIESVFHREQGEIVYVKKPEASDAKGPDKPKSASDPREAWKQHFEERKIETDLASLSLVQVTSGLKIGEEVALEDPTKMKKKEEDR